MPLAVHLICTVNIIFLADSQALLFKIEVTDKVKDFVNYLNVEKPNRRSLT